VVRLLNKAANFALIGFSPAGLCRPVRIYFLRQLGFVDYIIASQSDRDEDARYAGLITEAR
jgi:hypothetical protein